MFFRAAIISCVLSSFTVAAAQTRSATLTGVSQSSKDAGSAIQGVRPDDVSALRDDIRRMRSLVQQMESNLAFVDTTQSPLKHQFQLEIDMWKTVIGEMERKLDSSGARQETGSPGESLDGTGSGVRK